MSRIANPFFPLILLVLASIFSITPSIGDAGAATVTQPVQCIMNELDSARAMITISIGNLAPLVLSCNGESVNLAVSPSANVTAKEPTDGSMSRYRFDGGAKTVFRITCSEGTCPEWTIVDFEELPINVHSIYQDFVSSSTTEVRYTQAGSVTSQSLLPRDVLIWDDYDQPIYSDVDLPASNSTSQYSSVPLTRGLIGYWPMDEGTGTEAYDLTGNGHTGSLHGSPVWLTGNNCKFGDCLQFNSSSGSNVQVAGKVGLATDTFSVSAWFNPSKVSGESFVFFSENNPTTGNFEAIGLTSNAKLCIDIDGKCYISSYSLSAGRWYNVVSIDDAGRLTVYVDGQIAGSASIPSSNFLNSAVYLGGISQRFNFNGIVDDVRLYDRAISASEVASLYLSSIPDVEFTPTTSNNTFTFHYYHQNLFSISCPVSDGFTLDGPVLTYVSLGEVQRFEVPNQTANFWLDTGSKWNITNPEVDSNLSQRWLINGTTDGVANSSASIHLTCRPQFLIWFDGGSNSSGSISPSGSLWVNADSPVIVRATSSSLGTRFESWSWIGQGESVARIVAPSESSTDVTFRGPGTLVAMFGDKAPSSLGVLDSSTLILAFVLAAFLLWLRTSRSSHSSVR